jgi:hypothetical protein
VSRKIDTAALAEFRKQLQILKSKGLILRGSAGGRDPIVPGDPVSLGRPGGRAIRGKPEEKVPYFFDVYPEARNLSNGIFWRFIEKKTAENLAKLKVAVAALDKKTEEVEKLYGNKYETLNGERLRNYLGQVREAMANFK